MHDQAKVTGDWDLFLRGREFDAKRVRVASRAGAGEYEEDESSFGADVGSSTLQRKTSYCRFRGLVRTGVLDSRELTLKIIKREKCP